MSNEKEIEKQEKVKMPWQGKVWFAFFSLSVILSVFSIILFWVILPVFEPLTFLFLKISFIFQSVIRIFFTSLLFNPFLFAFVDIFLTCILSVVILYFFYKGKKIIIIFLLFSDLYFIPYVLQKFFSLTYGGLCFFNILILCMFLFSIYLEIYCFVHPYFNQKN